MLRTIAALIGASAAAAAHAIPVTVTFSGVVAFYRDLSTGSLVRENAGLPVSGFITYDSDRAQTVSTTQGPPLTSFSASSKSGCRQVINGACTQDSGPFSSVVIDYRFSFGQQDFGPLAPDLGYYAASGHYTLSRSSGSRIWNSHLDQDQALITGDLDSSYQRHFVNRSIELTPSSTGPLDLLTGSPLDPTVGFDLAAVPSDQLNLFFEDYRYSEACTVVAGENVCSFVGNERYAPGSFIIFGRLTHAEFRVGAGTPAPEPSSLVLMAVGVFGLIVSRRRKLAGPIA